MNEISCEICMDLIPLVRDGVASDDSQKAVQHHIEGCEVCRQFWEADIPPENGQASLKKVQGKIRLFCAMVLMFGILWGISLTASSGLFYNIVIMPVLGAVSYYVFRWHGVYILPCLLLMTHLITNYFGVIPGTERLDLPSLLLWTMLYCGFALTGILIAALLAFVFRKEDKS